MSVTQQPTLFSPRPARIHAARVENSPRLQRVLAVLQRGGKFTTRQIVEEAHVMAVSACVAELRAGGIDVRCEQVGRGRFEYWIPETGGN